MGSGLKDFGLNDKIYRTFRLGLILVLLSIPSFVLLRFRETGPLLARVPPLFWGFWAIFSIWIILAKALPHVLTQTEDILSTLWLFLGLANLIAAIRCLCFM
jgi:hypothetical protein